LRDHQHASDQPSRSALADGSAVAQRRDLRGSECVPRRHHSKEHARQHGDAGGEEQHAKIGLHVELKLFRHADDRTTGQKHAQQRGRTHVRQPDADQCAATDNSSDSAST
jgi:hypothetical protein